MNDPQQALDKIDELIRAARATDDLFSRAAAFSAISILVQRLDDFFEEKAPYAGENVERLRHHSAALLGYDITNGHGNEQQYVWVLSAISALEQVLRKLNM